MNKQQLAAKIWESANKMRSKIEANEYKDYILGFIFYKFLSETEIARLRAEDWGDEDLKGLDENDAVCSPASSTRCRLVYPNSVPMRKAVARPLATSSTSSRTFRWTAGRITIPSASFTNI